MFSPPQITNNKSSEVAKKNTTLLYYSFQWRWLKVVWLNNQSKLCFPDEMAYFPLSVIERPKTLQQGALRIWSSYPEAHFAFLSKPVHESNIKYFSDYSRGEKNRIGETLNISIHFHLIPHYLIHSVLCKFPFQPFVYITTNS